MNSLPITLNLYHDEDFVFRNPFRFKEREGRDMFQFIAYFNETMAKPFRWTMEAKPLTG
jgi:hypothetical protein